MTTPGLFCPQDRWPVTQKGKGEHGINCREFTPCSQGMHRRNLARLCTRWERREAIPPSPESHTTLPGRAPQTGQDKSRRMASAPSLTRTPRIRPLLTDTRNCWDPLLSSWGEADCACAARRGGGTGKPQMSPQHPTEVFPTVLDRGCAACENPCAFQEAAPARTQRDPGAFPAFPGHLGHWAEASHSSRCSQGSFCSPKPKTPPTASSTGGSGDTLPKRQTKGTHHSLWVGLKSQNLTWLLRLCGKQMLWVTPAPRARAVDMGSTQSRQSCLRAQFLQKLLPEG